MSDTHGKMPTVRRPNLDYENAGIPRFYYRGSKVLTNFWNVFHAAATPVEAFFIRDGNKSKERISDPVLLAQVDNFVQQEAHHSGEHHRVNMMLENRGYPVRWAQDQMYASLETLSGDDKEQLRLAVVVAGEHFLGELGYLWLVDDAMMDGMDPTMATLFKWHGYEEFEHHHIALDAYTHIFGRGPQAYFMRLRGITTFFRVFFPPLNRIVKAFHEVDGIKLDRATRRELLHFHLVSPGFARKLAGKLLPILSPWFHPSKFRDVSGYLEEYQSVVRPEWEVEPRR